MIVASFSCSNVTSPVSAESSAGAISTCVALRIFLILVPAPRRVQKKEKVKVLSNLIPINLNRFNTMVI